MTRIDLPLWLGLLSAMFVATSVGVAIMQRGAESCPGHRKSAGLLA